MDTVTLYRALIDRTSRRTHSTAIVHAGGRRTIFGCVCGARHTEAATWGRWLDEGEGSTRSVHARRWREEHAGCMRVAVERAAAERLNVEVCS